MAYTTKYVVRGGTHLFENLTVSFQVPFDSRRLVFPPFPAAMVVYLGYSIYRLLLPSHVFEIVIGGTILGKLKQL